MCVSDEFSEYLLENRVPTSADFNTYPIRFFCFGFDFRIIDQSKSINSKMFLEMLHFASFIYILVITILEILRYSKET